MKSIKKINVKEFLAKHTDQTKNFQLFHNEKYVVDPLTGMKSELSSYWRVECIAFGHLGQGSDFPTYQEALCNYLESVDYASRHPEDYSDTISDDDLPF